MQRRALLIAALAPPAARAQAAPPPELAGAWPGAAVAQGSGRLRFLGLAVYDITLWAPATWDASAWSDHPLALTITYHRAIPGTRLAERSLHEMRRGGPLAESEAARWLAAMQAVFPDVAEGDRLTGLHLPGQGARFHHQGRPRGGLAEPAFATRFFGIWLAPWTSEPALRQQLLGIRG